MNEPREPEKTPPEKVVASHPDKRLSDPRLIHDGRPVHRATDGCPLLNGHGYYTTDGGWCRIN